MFADVYPTTAADSVSLIGSNGCDTDAYFTKSVKIHGNEFQVGCETNLPHFALVQAICVKSDVKYFVTEELNVEYFEPRMLCYVVVPSTVVLFVMLFVMLINSTHIKT